MKILINALKNKRKLIFFDLEGTQFSQEIIAIAAIKVTLDAKFNIKKIDKKGFKQYVKAKDEVGTFVSKLTHITDSQLKKEGIAFEKAINLFKSYVGTNPEEYTFICYGNYDLRLFFNTSHKNDNYGETFIKIISKNCLDFSNFSSTYIKDNKGNKCSLIESIVALNETPLTNEHDPLVDTKNLIILFSAFLNKKEEVAREYKKVLLNYGKYQKPIINILKKLSAGQNVSPQDFDQYINDTFI